MSSNPAQNIAPAAAAWLQLRRAKTFRRRLKRDDTKVVGFFTKQWREY
jgi:hypothetical protein